jgi:hypothetical protein
MRIVNMVAACFHAQLVHSSLLQLPRHTLLDPAEAALEAALLKEERRLRADGQMDSDLDGSLELDDDPVGAEPEDAAGSAERHDGADMGVRYADFFRSSKRRKLPPEADVDDVDEQHSEGEAAQRHGRMSQNVAVLMWLGAYVHACMCACTPSTALVENRRVERFVCVCVLHERRLADSCTMLELL